ncbi:MAG: divalent metal cation transporter [Calditrichaeota bacterium]|nr:divalent metal cation transporter [Calditrichota bacterium]
MKIAKTIKSFLPGIFLLGFNIGTGSVTAMAKAGATYGMSLLWTILLSCLVTYFMIITYGRFTLITGETALYAFRKHIHPAVGIFFIVAMIATVSGGVIGLVGIIADVSYEWSRQIIPGGISQIYFALFFISLVYIIFWKGTTDFFQRVLAIFVAIMAASFIINFFILTPSAGEILKGLVPNIPRVPADQGKGPFLVIASMVGTTVASVLFIVRTTLVKEAGWTIKDLHLERRDAALSSFMMFVISGVIMAAAAGTLYVQGAGLYEASQMVDLLQPLAGRFAVTIFVFGIVAAGVSSQFPNILLLPWLLCDYNQSKRDMTLPQYRIMVFLISLLGLVVPVFHAKPVVVMIASQAFGALLLPVTVLCIIYLGNRKDVMGKENVNKLGTNIILGLILIFSIYMCGSGILGLLGTILY